MFGSDDVQVAIFLYVVRPVILGGQYSLSLATVPYLPAYTNSRNRLSSRIASLFLTGFRRSRVAFEYTTVSRVFLQSRGHNHRPFTVLVHLYF